MKYLEGKEAAAKLAAPGEPAEVVFEVPDIHCTGCERNIETRLGDRQGVDAVAADAKTHRVRVAFQPEPSGCTRSRKQ